MAEVVIGTLVVGLLLTAAVLTLRVTEKGTVDEKKRQDALDLAKGKAEELKSYLSSQNWNNMQVDVRYPPVTPAATPYNSYPPTTITMGKNQYILDPEVRYVYSGSTSLLQYVPTPATAATPETGDMVRIRVDAYYGPLNQWVPLPTAEAVSNLSNRVVYSNILTNRTINVTSTSFINGHVVYSNPCDTSKVVGGVLVGLYQGAQQIMTAITDSNGYFQFQNVPLGVWTVEIVSAPGFEPISGYSCNMADPVTLTSSGVADIWLGADPIQVWNYYGVVGYRTPVVIPVPPGSPTPTPVPWAATPTFIPVANAFVFSDDGNSKAVTGDSNGNFLIPEVRSTPVAGHTDGDTLEADIASPVSLMGRNYNLGSTMYPVSVSGGQTYIGPITICLSSPLTNTMPVTFLVLDYDNNSGVNSNFYPVTLDVADGSVAPPSTIFANGSGGVTAVLNVHPGVPQVSVYMGNNKSPLGYSTFNQTLAVDASVTSPVTLYNYAVGSMAGTVAGMGASFNYAQFQVVAQDVDNQFSYQIPISYDGASTFGTFNYGTLRTPDNGTYNGNLDYVFSINSGGDYTSSQVQQTVKWDRAQTLTQPLLVGLLNVYMAVTVTRGGAAYPYGSWVSAQMWPGGSAPGPLPTPGMGNGFAVDRYFSTVTRGDGTGMVQVQLDNGGPTTYTVTAQVVDPDTYALSSKSVTLIVPINASYTNPQGVSFGF